jgi:hypothetical protein
MKVTKCESSIFLQSGKGKVACHTGSLQMPHSVDTLPKEAGRIFVNE